MIDGCSGLDANVASGLMAFMCRLASYLGPSITLENLLEGSPHSLLRQSYAAKELETSVVSADGWGAAWYLPVDPIPCLYRSTLPIWGDLNRSDLSRANTSHAMLAAVRSATDPLSISGANTQPFRFGELSFVHNGYLEQFRDSLRRDVCERLSDTAYQLLRGDTDSEHFFALVVDGWLSRATNEPLTRLIGAVQSAVQAIRVLVQERSLKALLTLVVSDGRHMVAARAAYHATSPSLYVRRDRGSAAIYFASEPLDPAQQDWQPVADGSIVSATLAGNVRVASLESEHEHG